jgi:carbon storage regulator
MLVLTRKLNERIMIGDDICVTVVRIEGGQVRLGVEAPRDVTIAREELLAPAAAPVRRARLHSALAAAPRHID